jgi:flavin reductase (DIM6/NTAB) family NADH-FMN oxidoreductase RutF
MTEDNKASIGKALGRIVSGVYILTAAHEGKTSAMMASWVCQAGFDPPAITVALAKKRPIAPLIRGSRKFAISIIAADDKTLMKFYARYKGDTDPFEGLKTKLSASGIPVLADSLGYLECDLMQFYETVTDHDLLLGKVIGGEQLREGTAFAHQRGSGFHY